MSTAYTLYRQGLLRRDEVLSRLLEHHETVQEQIAALQGQAAVILSELAAIQTEPCYDAAALDALCDALTGDGLGPIAYRIAACKRGETQV